MEVDPIAIEDLEMDKIGPDSSLGFLVASEYVENLHRPERLPVDAVMHDLDFFIFERDWSRYDNLAHSSCIWIGSGQEALEWFVRFLVYEFWSLGQNEIQTDSDVLPEDDDVLVHCCGKFRPLACNCSYGESVE